MKPKTHTDLTIILDESGSMSKLRDATISGFNEFVQQQEQLPGTADITLWKFNDRSTKVFTKPLAPAGSVRISPKDYQPDSRTALLDTVGAAINDAGMRLSQRPHDDPANVIFVIITDGEENSSTQFKLEQIKSMITHQREKYAWQFLFLGANIDVFKAGFDLGIDKNMTQSYVATSAGTQAVYKQACATVSSIRAQVTP